MSFASLKLERGRNDVEFLNPMNCLRHLGMGPCRFRCPLSANYATSVRYRLITQSRELPPRANRVCAYAGYGYALGAERGHHAPPRPHRAAWRIRVSRVKLGTPEIFHAADAPPLIRSTRE